ncbi:DUF4112 domain-containing protein [uncultured Thalassolituus sp.]|uniref:DUF4112 domain-containing protein n=1 Tax=uncultured Thalassolituus sp. TaxID=285273 RepID=UPI0026058581|nr:DUF4112 domain-containing protein [uncultured Thalassolituus sp.]
MRAKEVEASPDFFGTLRRVENYARLMDARFRVPFTPFTVGVDGLIGLLPGVGDAVSFVLALYPLFEAKRMKVGRELMIRMFLNIVIDTVIGSIPLIGDLFDIGFKANIRNANLLKVQADQKSNDGS